MSGRAKVGGSKFPVQLGEGVAERIDALAGPGKRGAYIRAAVREALARDERSGSARTLRVRSVSFGEMKPDAVALLKLVAGKPISEREASKSLGWPELRVSKAASALGSRIIYAEGRMHAVPEGLD